jgi:protein-disulfide isomerase
VNSHNANTDEERDPGNAAARTATARMRAARDKERSAERRGRQLKAAGVVAGVLAAAAGVSVLVAQISAQKGPADDAKPIAVGKQNAPATLTVYEDFRCPACAQFERQLGPTVRELHEQGRLRAEYHLVTLIDDNLGGKGSHRAANAAACAKDAGRFGPYHDVLFRNQPPEKQDAFGSTERLIELAGEVDGLNDRRFRDCVTGEDHAEWVRKASAAFEKSRHNGTPTVLLDGESVYGGGEPLTPETLKKKVRQAG